MVKVKEEKVKKILERLEKRRLSVINAFINNRIDIETFIDEYYRISLAIEKLREIFLKGD